MEKDKTTSDDDSVEQEPDKDTIEFKHLFDQIGKRTKNDYNFIHEIDDLFEMMDTEDYRNRKISSKLYAKITVMGFAGCCFFYFVGCVLIIAFMFALSSVIKN